MATKVKKTMFTKSPRMSADEKRLAREMHFDRKVPRSEVAQTTIKAATTTTHTHTHRQTQHTYNHITTNRQQQR